MKRALSLLLAMLAVGTAGATDVGVSIAISQPGVYGRVDIGRLPPPVVVVEQPVWVHRPPVLVRSPEPVYLWVPPGHRRDWRRHCARYHACAAPVYFVDDRWYRRHVMPDRRGKRDGHRRGRDRGDDR